MRPYNFVDMFQLPEDLTEDRIGFALKFKMADGSEETYVGIRKGFNGPNCYIKKLKHVVSNLLETRTARHTCDDRISVFLAAYDGKILDCTFEVLQHNLPEGFKENDNAFVATHEPTINYRSKKSFGFEYEVLGGKKKKPKASRPPVAPQEEGSQLAIITEQPSEEGAPSITPTKLVEIIQGLADLEKMIPYKIILEPK